LPALIDVVLRLLQVVGDEDELARSVEVLDRKHAAEHGLEAHLLARVRRHVRLQELVVRALLDIDKVGNLDNLLHTAEVLAEAKVRLNHRRHRVASEKLAGTKNGTMTPRRPSFGRGAGEHKASWRMINTIDYLSSTFAPASSSFFFISAASALATPSFSV